MEGIFTLAYQEDPCLCRNLSHILQNYIQASCRHPELGMLSTLSVRLTFQDLLYYLYSYYYSYYSKP